MDVFFLNFFLIFFFFLASVGLTYEQSAVKLVVRLLLKSGTVLYRTHAHISLLNVTFVCSCLLGCVSLGESENGFMIPDHMDFSTPKKRKIRKRIILS